MFFLNGILSTLLSNIFSTVMLVSYKPKSILYNYFTKFSLATQNRINPLRTLRSFSKYYKIVYIYFFPSGTFNDPHNLTWSYGKWNTALSYSINKIPTNITWFSLFVTKVTKKLVYILHGIRWRSFSFGFYYIQGFVFLLFIDACLTDDEPLWEPIEWSLVQTWILFIFIFGWIAENLIVSRYGSYTGRDKRVWMGWYKTFWLIEMYYLINFLAAAVFVIVPFYFETNYSLSFIYTWWHWYSRVFFFKFISLFSIIILLAYLMQIGLRWLNWGKVLVVVILINIFLSYLLYTHFIMSFFGYFTNPLWYQKTRPIDYVQLSHEPSKWGWGIAKRDHFTYHGTRTVFWFKNDGPFASAFLLFHLYVFLSFFFVYMYWITLFRRIYSTKEVPLTYVTYCVSSLKQLFYCFLCLYFFIFLSFLTQYWRLPVELFFGFENQSWLHNLLLIFLDYPTFLISVLK